MKSVFKLLFSSLFASVSTAQNQANLVYSPTVLHNGALIQMVNHPVNPNKLILLEESGFWPLKSYFPYEYDGSTGISASPISGSDSLSTPFTVIPSGLIFGGYNATIGNEPIFYNGQNSFSYDINQGSGSSDPVFFFLDGRTFFVAFNGTSRQLYEFIGANTISQISNETNALVTQVIGHRNDEVYYLTVFQDSIKQLKKAVYNGVNYTSNTLRNKTGIWYYWKYFGEAGNRAIFEENSISYYSGEQDLVRVFSVDNSTGNQLVMQEDSSVIANISSWSSVVHDGLNYLYRGTELKYTTDGVNLNLDQTIVDQVFTAHFLKNDELYYITHTLSDSNKLFKYSNNGLSLIYSGRHLHTSIVNQMEVYLTDLGYSHMSKYIRLSENDEIIWWNIIDSSVHPHVINDATMFQNKPYFLWNGTGLSPNFLGNMDIYKIDDFLSLEERKTSIIQSVFPNPVMKGEDIIVHCANKGSFRLLDGIGNVISAGQLELGKNRISTYDLSTGLYLLQSDEGSLKIIVN